MNDNKKNNAQFLSLKERMFTRMLTSRVARRTRFINTN